MFDKIKSSLASWIVKGNANTQLPFVSFVGQRIGTYLMGNRNNFKYLQEYKGWVYACVKARSEGFKHIKLHLYDRNQKEILKNPMLDLLNWVNPSMTRTQLFEATQAFLDLEGNAFWFLARTGKDGKGDIKEIYIMRPDRVQIIPSESEPLKVAGYVYILPDGKKVPFNPSEVLHFKNFNPMAEHPYPHRGMGIVEAASWAVDTENAAQEWNYSFFQNSARPDGVLYQDGVSTMSDDDFFRLKAQWEQAHQGQTNAHKIAILSGGMKWQEIGRTQKEMDFVLQRQWDRDQIMAMFQVPKTALGIVEDVNRANAEATNFVFADRTIKPLMLSFVDHLNEYLIPEYGDYTLGCESPVPEDQVADLNMYDKAVDRWMTRNEIRQKLGLDPIDGGDWLMAPLAVQGLGEASTVKELPQPNRNIKLLSSASGENLKAKMSLNSIVEGKFKEFVNKKKQLNQQAIDNYVKLWIGNFQSNENPLKKQVKAFFTAQEKEVLQNLKKAKKDTAEDILFDEEKSIDAAISLITPNITRYIQDSGGQAMQLAGSGLTFDITAPGVDEFIKKRSEFFADSINETTREELFNTLREGLDAGETVGELSERVAAVYGQARDFRTDRIARTEVAASANFGAVEAYQQAGVKKHKWIVVDPQDEDCLTVSDEVVNIGTNFSNNLEAPPVHPNCQCTTIPIFED